MIALGIETATSICGVALIRENMAPVERILEIPNVHSEQLVPLIEEVLDQSRTRVDQLDVIAVSIGPGSFTGLRIGLSTAKGLSFAADIPLIPVPTLEALAYNVIRAGVSTSGTSVLSLLDAHRGDAYWSVYRISQDLALEEVRPAAIAPYEAIIRWAQNQTDVVVVGDAGEIINGHLELQQFWNSGCSRCNPVSVVILGVQRYQAGERADRSSLEPQYLREFTPRGRSGA